jgi:hypothetical protein
MSTNIAEKILNGPEYFYCERHKLRMKKEHCVEWQTPGAAPFELDKSIVECANCEQGKEIKRLMIDDGLRPRGAYAPVGRLAIGNFKNHQSTITNHKSIEGEKMENKMCKRCGKEPAMLRKSGRVVNGLGLVCHGETRNQGKGKRKYIRKIAPKIISPILPAVIVPVNNEIYKSAAARFVRAIEARFVEAIKAELEERPRA